MKVKTAILCESPDQVQAVYSGEQLARLAEISELLPGIYCAADVAAGKLSAVEALFSTWGMPALDNAALDRLPNLKIVFYAAGATDGFARPLLARGIRLMSAWRMNGVAVSEFCLAQIMLSLKGYFRVTRAIAESGDWMTGKQFIGPGGYGETVALLGDGVIATRLRGMLEERDLKVLFIPSRPWQRTVSFEEAFRTAMVVSNHLPDRADNVHCIGREHFASMRPGATFLNTGRGAQIDETALVEVFRGRPDLTALLDVSEPEPPPPGSPLYTLPNVHLSCHIAGAVHDETRRMAACAIAEFKNYASGLPLRHLVDESMLITSSK